MASSNYRYADMSMDSGGNVRKYTNHLLDLVDDGALSKDHVIMACIKYMSEADVQDMMEYNGFIEPDQLDKEEE